MNLKPQRHRFSAQAFTLIELMLVMAILLIVLAVSFPSLRGFFRGRNLDNEARRFLSLELEFWGYVPFDPSVGHAVRLQEPVVTSFPHAPSSIAYRALAERLWDPNPQGPTPSSRPLVSEQLEA